MANLIFVESTRPGIHALEVAKQLGHHVTYVTAHQMDWLIGDDGKAEIARHADSMIEVADSHDPDMLTAALRGHQTTRPVDAVLSTLHQFVEPAAIAARRLGVRGVSPDGVRRARDKARCRDILIEHRIPSVRHRLVRSVTEALDGLREIGYPAIVKPTTGVGKVLTSIVHDEQQLIEHFERAGRSYEELRAGVKQEITLEFVVEELARGPLYSFEIGVTGHGEYVPFALLKRKLGKHNPILELGSTIPGDLDAAQYDAAVGYAVRVLQATGLDLGVFHLEFIYTADGPRLVEVNPRIAGAGVADLIRDATGADLYEYLVRIYAGERLGIRGLTCRSAASHTYIGAFDDCVVRSDLPPDWFEPFKREITSGSVNIVAGQALRRMDGNYDLYGALRVTARDHATAVRRTEELRRAVEAELGVKLVEVTD